MDDLESPNYYAVIPADVRYDKNLKDKAKLLYGEITCLSNKKGYCYASNKYFADLYNVNATTISSLISNLVDNGYITREIIYKEGTKEIKDRYLKISKYPSYEKSEYPSYENSQYPIMKNQKDNNINNNITSNNNITPNKEELDKLKEHFDIIWEEYPNKKGKAKAFVYFLSWIKGRKIGGINVKVTDRQQWYAVMRYKAECEKNKTEEKYIKHGDTFFNNAILDYVKDIEEDEPL